MKHSIFWFRRDLRLEDNTALYHALDSGLPVILIFIFDTTILENLPKNDARVSFIYERLHKLNTQLRRYNSTIHVFQGEPLKVWEQILKTYEVQHVFINKDYEPYARERDDQVANRLKHRGIILHRFKDQVIFEESGILKGDGKPYTVYTPYKKKWLNYFTPQDKKSLPTPNFQNLHPSNHSFSPLEKIGFTQSNIQVKEFDLTRLEQYAANRDFPAEGSTSYLSPHLRFGTVSIRQVIDQLKTSDEVFLSELIWREFFMQILFHFPHVVHQNFHPKYNGIHWRNNEQEFEHWCEGRTGYPLVDAGMRQLNNTGYMHNRVRMVTASFLCKHLLIDWRWGEAYFAEKLLDYELSSNNGNWQWAAGTGCDAAPYFRVFNPFTQQQKFDKNLTYVKQWVPEYGTPDYVHPIVEHTFARKRALDAYKNGLTA